MSTEMKDKIKSYYGNIAKTVDKASKASCCSSTSCCESPEDLQYASKDLSTLIDEVKNASLGCANPVMLADLQAGETVLDLGSGGGIDVFISSRYVGPTGKVIGLDMTDEMLALAKRNQAKMEITNVEFVKGYIEQIPLADHAVNVVMSNCVINLCEDKEAALREAYRVLKPGGRLAIADIVQLKDVPDEIQTCVEMWVGCIAGALKIADYRQILENAGFVEIEITPVNFYTKEMIEGYAVQKGSEQLLKELDANALDSAYAGAHVKAKKK